MPLEQGFLSLCLLDTVRGTEWFQTTHSLDITLPLATMNSIMHYSCTKWNYVKATVQHFTLVGKDDTYPIYHHPRVSGWKRRCGGLLGCTKLSKMVNIWEHYLVMYNLNFVIDIAKVAATCANYYLLLSQTNYSKYR